METEIVSEQSVRESVMPRSIIRNKSDEMWINDHASGTLRKAFRLGFAWRTLYVEERTAHEWGWEFRCVPRTHVLMGAPQVEGDQSSVTEALWHIERYRTLNPFPDSDLIYPCYVHVSSEEAPQGIGMFVKRTSASWLTKGHIVYCIIAEYDLTTKAWKRAKNPF